MTDFKEKLLAAGMNEPLATLLDEKLTEQANCRADAASAGNSGDVIKRWCTGKRRLPVLVALGCLAVITLAALKYLLFHW